MASSWAPGIPGTATPEEMGNELTLAFSRETAPKPGNPAFGVFLLVLVR
jgi:hypothetical protein